jgi:hypothetical protein
MNHCRKKKIQSINNTKNKNKIENLFDGKIIFKIIIKLM